MNNIKTTEFPSGIAPTRLFLANQAAHSRVANCLAERFQFLRFALSFQLDSAIAQVANRSRDFKPRGHCFDRVAEPDALHTSRIINLQTTPAHIYGTHECAGDVFSSSRAPGHRA